MLWGPSKQPGKEYQLVLDIGTTLLKAYLFTVEDNEVHIAAKSFQEQQPGSMRGGMIVDLSSVIETAKIALNEVSGPDINITSVILGVNGQLVEGVTTTVHYDRAFPDHPLDAAELKNIIYKIQQRSSDKLRANLQEKFADTHPDVELIHAGIVEVQLDGYAVDSPIGFQGKRLSLTIFNAYIPLVYASILGNLAKSLKLELASIAAQPYGLSKAFVGAITETPSDDEEDPALNGIFIDVGGGTTDVVLVRNGTVEGMQSFAIGGEAFTKQIKQALDVSTEKAEKLKFDYAAATATEKVTAQIAEVLSGPTKTWLTGVEMSLREFSDLKLLPSRIYLTGGSAKLPELRRLLMTKSWTEGLPFAKKPYPKIITPEDVDLVVDDVGLDWDDTDIPPLGVAKLCLDLPSEHQIVANTLQSIVRSMK